MTYQVIRDEHSSQRLAVPPSEVWIISSLEIVVRQDRDGDPHLLLITPSYAFTDGLPGPEHDEGYWAPPFNAYPVPRGFSTPTTTDSLRRLVDQHTAKLDLVWDLRHLAYQLGLRDTELAYRERVIELKTSPRTPTLVKAYAIVRHALVAVDDACVRNLADPDVRRGYVFLPLSRDPPVLRASYSAAHDRVEQWFLGKPLMSNVEYVVTDDARRSTLQASAITIPSDLTSRQERGLLCAVDLAGYGTALRYADEEMHSFTHEPHMIQRFLRRSVASYFDQTFQQLGVMQVHTAGDGFIAAMPDRVFGGVASTMEELLRAWAGTVTEVARLNAAIRDPTLHIGSRMALHYGSYEYGRISGIRSTAASFDGASIIEVTRLEQGLGAAMRGGQHLTDAEGAAASLRSKGNYVALSSVLQGKLGAQWRPSVPGYHHLGHLELGAKEFSDRADLLELSVGGQREPH